LRVVVDDEQVSDEQPADPGLVIPNDDPRCRCALEPGKQPDDAVAIIGSISPGLIAPGTSVAAGQEFRVALHAGCPHHGPVLRQMSKGALGAFSIGAQGHAGPPATPPGNPLRAFAQAVLSGDVAAGEETREALRQAEEIEMRRDQQMR
jgi:hypothetical protein